MHNRILLQSSVLFILTICLTFALQKPDAPNKRENNEVYDKHEIIIRARRAAHKPGFFRTLFSVVFEQWNDTKNTVGTINRLINDNFLPDNAPVTEPPIVSANISTTEAPYRITRAEFNKILRRNLRGLQRLFNIELQDALKESEKYGKQFRKNVSVEVAKFL